MTIRNYTLTLEILPVEAPVPSDYTISVEVLPLGVSSSTLRVPYNFTIDLSPVEINITEPIRRTAYRFLDEIISDFIDENRELKTLVNFGEDTQTVALNYRYGIPDASGNNTIQLKLLRPLPDEVGLNTPTFLSREVANTVIDKVRVRFAPPIDATPYLRPRNERVDYNKQLGKSLNNVTLKVLSLETGSFGSFDTSKNLSFEDSIFRRWYSYDFDSAELNIDFSDYNNFVFYGSATMRLAAFKEKLRQLERLQQDNKQFIGTVFTGSFDSVGSSLVLNESAEFSKQKEDIIRSFDRYEQYLYFTPSGSNNPYSGSLWYDDDWYDYNPIGYWPKTSSGSLYSVSSSIAQDWYTTQSAIAERFDEGNENNLINTIPTHIREHEDNAPYFTFVAMIGHFFDTIKPYIDQFPNIQSRYLNPDEELSKELVTAVAESVGFELPTLNSIYNLSETILGDDNTEPRRKYTIQTHKRLLHNLPYFAKTKGTRESIVSALKTLGLTEQLITVREAGSANTGSINVFDEYTRGLEFTTANQLVALPLSASRRTPYPRSLQFGVKIPNPIQSTIVNGDDLWALNVNRHPTNSSLGRFEIVSGSNKQLIMSSSYEKIFDNDLLNVSIRTYENTLSANLFVGKVEREDIIFTSSFSEVSGSDVFVDMWNSTNNLYVGGSGSITTGSFRGIVDEVRLWGINLTDENTVNAMFDPATNAGNQYDDASEHLYIQLSFNKIDDTLLPVVLRNESPYRLQNKSPSLQVIQISNISSTSFTRYNRIIRQKVPQIGGSTFVTNKVKIADPPVFKETAISRNGVKQLSRTRSIVKLSEKERKRGRNNILIGTSPTQLINQQIIRNVGLENINNMLGIPNPLYRGLDLSLEKLREHYVQYYYVDVNYNRYIRILSSINSVIGQLIDYFVPSRANTLNGIIIEPNILERNRIEKFGKIRLYGSDSRKSLNAPGALTGSKSDYGATFNLTKTIDTRITTIPTGSYVNLKGNVDSPEPSLDSVTSNLKGTVEKTPEEISSLYRTFTSQSSKVEFPELSTLGSVNVYDLQHENLREYNKIQSGSRKYKKSSISLPDKDLSSQYLVFDRQHEPWNQYLLISQSLKKSEPSSINAAPPNTIQADFKLYDLQHLDWAQYRIVSSSSEIPHPKQVIDLGVDNLNKVSFNSSNHGSPAADPYNRLYTRKLFDTEISSSRAGGLTSIYTPALYEIKPRADFNDPGVVTFFNKRTGIYYFEELEYTPVPRRLLNNPWNGETFVGATTWSYGASYNEGDVVYQNITSQDTQLGDLLKPSRKGNGKYYVFKAKNYSRVPVTGEAVIVGSIPTNVPPSIDRDKWSLIKFKPIQVRKPKRIVFDTFRVPDPSLNNFQTTTVDINRIIDVQGRYLDTYTIGNVSPGARVTGEISVQNIALLFALQASDDNIRVRFYRTQDARDTDVNRSISTTPDPEDGVLIDVNLTEANTTQLVNPPVALIADNIPPNGRIFYTVDNLDIVSKLNITLLAYYYAVEVEPRVPQGYLKKHYRFYKDNFLATRRRNYLGCKNTINTTIDGLPPVQIFIGEGTELNVSPSSEGNEIITGGGGTLDVN